MEGNYYKAYEVVSMVGYKDIETFRDTFKEYFSIPPSDIQQVGFDKYTEWFHESINFAQF